MSRQRSSSDSGMRPMEIVSSGEDGSCLPNHWICRNRMVVFLAGIALTVLAVILGLTLNKPKPAEPVPQEPWVVTIDLQPDMYYDYNTSSASSTTIQYKNLSIANMTHDQNEMFKYRIDKMCGNTNWSYVRFMLNDLDSDRLNDPGSMYMLENGADDETIVTASRKFRETIREVVEGMTFTSKLGHAGEVYEEDAYNLDSVMDHAVSNLVDSLASQALDDDDREELVRELGDIGREEVKVLQHAIYPALQSNPPNSRPVKEGDSWTRDLLGSGFGECAMDVKYTLSKFIASGLQPRILSPYHYQQDGAVGMDGEGWLIIEVAFGDDVTTESWRRCLEEQMADSPVGGAAKTSLTHFEATFNLTGLLVVSASTGVVLDSQVIVQAEMDISITVTVPGTPGGQAVRPPNKFGSLRRAIPMRAHPLIAHPLAAIDHAVRAQSERAEPRAPKTMSMSMRMATNSSDIGIGAISPKS